MRIGILCHPTIGGSGVVAARLADSLARRGHRVHIFTHAKPSHFQAIHESVTVHVAQGLPYPVFKSPPHDLAVTSRILEVHAAGGLDLLHAHYAIPNATSALLARAAVHLDGGKLPVITTLHGTDITLIGKDSSYAALTRYALRASDAVTSVSQSLLRDTKRLLLSGSSLQVRVIPNFVDVRQRDRSPSANGTGDPAVRILHASNFRPLKRVSWLVQAFACAREKVAYQLRLTLVGNGPDEATVRRQVEQLGIEQHVEFLGQRSDLNELLQSADIYACSSAQESFGLASLEAMAAGLPVLSTDVGGVSEVVEHKRTGLLSGAADQQAFIENLIALAGDKTLRGELGQAGKSRAQKEFSQSEVVSRYEALYREVIDK
jgi:N-acetyl-alpha-D-glucosaminyl L-malate synthase BshA